MKNAESRHSALAIADVLLIRPRFFPDSRGHFAETYRRDAFAAAGINVNFVQENQSLSSKPWTIRGLHFQRPPAAQAKLVRVVADAYSTSRSICARARRPSANGSGRRLLSGGEQIFIPRASPTDFARSSRT